MRVSVKTLISFVIQLVVALALVVVLYNSFVDGLDLSLIEYRQYIGAYQAWQVRCWSDAFFVPAVLWTGLGAMMWIATTGFFDIFSYAFSSLLVLFSVLKNPRDHKHYFEYKQDREERRKEKGHTHTTMIVGIILMVVALALVLVHGAMVPATESLPESTGAFVQLIDCGLFC